MKKILFFIILVFFYSCKQESFNKVFSIEKDNPYYFFIVAESKFIQGNYKEALEYYNKVIELDSKDLFVKGKKAASLISLGKIKEGKKILKYVIQNGLNDKQLLFLFVSLVDKDDDRKLLMKTYDKLLKQEGINKVIVYKKADLLIYQKEYLKAINLVKNYLKKEPYDYAMYFFLASIYKKIGRHRAAKKVLLRIGKTKQKTIDAIVELLSLYRENSTDKDYLNHLVFLYKFNPNDFILYEMLTSVIKMLQSQNNKNKSYALNILEHHLPYLEDDLPLEKALYLKSIQVLFDLEEFDIALESLRRANMSISDDSIRYATAIAYLNIGDQDDAIPLLNSIKRESKLFKTSVAKLINIYNDRGTPADSLILLKKHKDILAKDNKFYTLLLVSVYEKVERYDEAIQELESLLDTEQENTQIRFYYAFLLFKAGKKYASIVQAKKILKEDPSNIDALNHLAYTYSELNENLDEARLLIERAVKLKSNDPYIIDTRAWVYYKLKNYELSFKDLKKSIKLFKKEEQIDKVILEHIIKVTLKLNKRKDAQKYYEILQSNINNSKFLTKIQGLLNDYDKKHKK